MCYLKNSNFQEIPYFLKITRQLFWKKKQTLVVIGLNNVLL